MKILLGRAAPDPRSTGIPTTPPENGISNDSTPRRAGVKKKRFREARVNPEKSLTAARVPAIIQPVFRQ
jgi:hypothetical protein